MNLCYENLDGESITDILTKYKGHPSTTLKECDHCDKETNHIEIIKVVKPPDVLIISLIRFNQIGTKFIKDRQEVEPCPEIELDDSLEDDQQNEFAKSAVINIEDSLLMEQLRSNASIKLGNLL